MPPESNPENQEVKLVDTAVTCEEYEAQDAITFDMLAGAAEEFKQQIKVYQNKELVEETSPESRS